jgi:DNA-binding MarR family transcriptional regulator
MSDRPRLESFPSQTAEGPAPTPEASRREDRLHIPPRELPCLGRRGPLAEVDRALQEASRGVGSTWVFTGPAGIGKSRLLREVERLGGRRGFRTLWGYSLAHSPTALFPFAQILVRLDDKKLPRALARSKSVALRFLALTDAIERAAERQPLLLLLDDLNDADAESVRLLAMLARLIARERVMIVAGFREDQVVDETTLAGREALATAQRSGFVRTIPLRPLEEPERIALIASYFGQSPERFVADEGLNRLVQRVGGNPYYLVETVAQLVADGDIKETRSGWRLVSAPEPGGEQAYSPSELPLNVRQLILDRYTRLAPGAQEAVRLAALLGVEFDTAPLAAALGRSARGLLGLLSRLATVGWPIRADPRLKGRFIFEHALLQECLADPVAVRLDPASARRLERWWTGHRPKDLVTLIRIRLALGDEIGAVSAATQRTDAALADSESRLVPGLLRWVGRGSSPGGEADRRLTALYVDVAERLRARLEYDVCLRLLPDLEARDLPPETRWRVELWRLEIEVRHGAGHMLAGLAEFERRLPPGAADRSPELSLRIAYLHALMALWVKPPRDAWHEIRTVLDRVGPGEYPFERCRLYENGVVALGNIGMLSDARRVLRTARRVAERAGLWEGPVGATLGHCQALLDRISLDATRSARSLRRVVAAYRRLGLTALEAEAMAELASAEMALRRLGPCREHLARAFRVGTRLGIESLVGYSQVLFGITDLLEGEWQRGRQSLEDARRTFATAPSNPTELVIAVGLEWARAELGDATGARIELVRLTQPPGSGHFAFEPEAFRVLARSYELEENTFGSREALRRAIGSARRIGDWPNLVGSVAELGEWNRRYGSRTTAARLLRQARSIAKTHRLRLQTEWAGIVFPRSPASKGVGRATHSASRPSAGQNPLHLSDTVLRCIAAGAGAHPADAPVGVTQQGIAASIGVARNRFAKALSRLERKGWIHRRAVRFEGLPRRVLAYTITPAGQRALLRAGPPEDRSAASPA